MAQYVVREHDRGRSLHDILEDKYVVNRLQSPEQRAALLDRPEIIHAVGGDTDRGRQELPRRLSPRRTEPGSVLDKEKRPWGRAVSVNQGEGGMTPSSASIRPPRPPFEGFARSEAVALLEERVGVVVVAVAAPRSRARPPASARSRAATWRSSRSTSRARSAAAASRARRVSGSPSAWVASIAPSRSRNSIGMFEVKPASA